MSGSIELLNLLKRCVMKKPFMDEVANINAEKIADEKIKEFWTAVVCILILLMFFILGGITGETIGERDGRNEIIQELCATQQYDFCVVKKVIYSIKEEK